MTFRTADQLLEAQIAGRAGPAAAGRLGIRLVCFGRGVAVCEMDPQGETAAGAITTLAEAAMAAAATTTVADGRDESPLAREITARFHGAAPVAATGPLRAEAVVVRAQGGALRVEAEVHCDGTGIATFEALYTPEPRLVAA